MGNKQGAFEKEKIEELQDCTYFSGHQIKRLYKKFASLNPQKICLQKADLDTKFVSAAKAACIMHAPV